MHFLQIVDYLGEQSEIIYRMQSSIISSSSRDLVCARVWREIATNSYIIAARHCTTDLMPPQPRIQRYFIRLSRIYYLLFLFSITQLYNFINSIECLDVC